MKIYSNEHTRQIIITTKHGALACYMYPFDNLTVAIADEIKSYPDDIFESLFAKEIPAQNQELQDQNDLLEKCITDRLQKITNQQKGNESCEQSHPTKKTQSSTTSIPASEQTTTTTSTSAKQPTECEDGKTPET